MVEAREMGERLVELYTILLKPLPGSGEGRRLGLISLDEEQSPKAPILVAQKWQMLLEDTEFAPIDVHTPLWLWSKSGFKPIARE